MPDDAGRIEWDGDESDRLFPGHLTAAWDALTPTWQKIIGSPWDKPDVNHRNKIDGCVRMLHHQGWLAESIIELAACFPDSLGRLAHHPALIRELWDEQAADRAKAAKAKAEADAAEAKRAAHLIVTDEPWDPATLPSRPWLAAPYLMRGHITLPHGPGGGGKSQLAICWAVALALGRTFGRLRPKGRCRVLLTNFEDSADEQTLRITAALEYFAASPVDLKGWLYRACIGPGSDATMFMADDFAVRATDTFESLQAHCERIRPDAVILDPLVAINAVHENDNMLIRRVMVIIRSQLAERFYAAVVLIHHDNKGGDDSEDSDQRNVRGGGDIVNAVRFELAVKKMTIAQAEQMNIEADRRGFYFRLGSQASKMNYSAPEESEWFERVAVEIAGEEVVRCIPWTPPSGKLSTNDAAALIAAVEKGTPIGPYSPLLTNTDRSLSPILSGLGVTSPSAQRRALKNLLSSGRVMKVDWLVPGRGATTRSGLRSDTGLPYNCKWQDAKASGDE